MPLGLGHGGDVLRPLLSRLCHGAREKRKGALLVSPVPKRAARDGATTAAMESVMEWCREHKLRAIGGVWVTGMGASMAYNMTQKHLGPMTKLVHSRVYAQALTLGCLVVSAGAENYDSKHNARTEEVDPYMYKAPMKAKGTH